MFDAKVHAQAEIDAPIEQVFDFLVAPDKIPLVMPGLIENRDIPPLPLRVGSQFTYKYQLYGVMFEGTWTVTALEAPTVYEARTTGGADSEWKYRLSEQDGKTNVSLTVNYETPRSLLEKFKSNIAEAMNQKEAETYMHNLKLLLELQRV